MSTPVDFPEQSAFVAWLSSKGSNDIVSHNWGCACCPLALFMKDRGHPLSAVFSNGLWSPLGLLADDEDTYPLPDWARAFVSLTDKHSRGPVTVGTCLSTLDPWRIACELDRMSIIEERKPIVTAMMTS